MCSAVGNCECVKCFDMFLHSWSVSILDPMLSNLTGMSISAYSAEQMQCGRN